MDALTVNAPVMGDSTERLGIFDEVYNNFWWEFWQCVSIAVKVVNLLLLWCCAKNQPFRHYRSYIARFFCIIGVVDIILGMLILAKQSLCPEDSTCMNKNPLANIQGFITIALGLGLVLFGQEILHNVENIHMMEPSDDQIARVL